MATDDEFPFNQYPRPWSVTPLGSFRDSNGIIIPTSICEGVLIWLVNTRA